jgi:hypothetical protein
MLQNGLLIYHLKIQWFSVSLLEEREGRVRIKRKRH